MFANLFKKYDPDQPRAPKGTENGGQWVSQGGGASTDSKDSAGVGVTKELFDRLGKPDGGFSYQTVTGKEPTEGFAVSPYPERSWAKDADKLTFGDLVRYAKKNADVLEQKNHFFGAWHDPATGRVFFDVSVVVDSREEAEKLSIKHDQIAFFDIKSGKSITVNSKATSGGVAKGDYDGSGKRSKTGTAGFGWQSLFGRSGAGEDVRKADRQEADPGRVEGSRENTFSRLIDLFKYDPDQPRAPKGTEDGGKWVSYASRLGNPASSLSEDQKIYSKEERDKLADQLLRENLADSDEFERFADAVREIEELGKVDPATGRSQETKSIHSVEPGKRGGYTRERLELHRQILTELIESARAYATPGEGEAPQLYVLGGKGGSGKSQFGSGGKNPLRLYDEKTALVLDADMFKTKLAIADGKAVKDSEGKWSVGKYAALYHEESGDLFDKAVIAARKEGLNTVMDVTLNSPHERRVVLFKDKGYRVTGMYMFLDKEKAAERAILRAKDNGTLNGRLVPPKYILSSTKNEKSFDKLLKYFDRAVVYHNNVPRGTDPVKVWPKSRDMFWTNPQSTAKKSVYSIFKKYDPNQPRAPKGTPDGGKWVATGAGKGAASVPNADDRHYKTFNMLWDMPYHHDADNAAEINAFAKAHEAVISGLTNNEKSSIEFYTSSGFRAINKYLAGDWPDKSAYKELQDYVDGLDSAISKSELGHNMLLFRRMGAQNFFKALKVSNAPRVLWYEGKEKYDMQKHFDPASVIGKVYEEKAFASTTVNPGKLYGMAFGNYKVSMHIRAKAESKGLFVSSLSAEPGESEVILPRNSRFLIRNAQSISPTEVRLHVDLL